MKHRKAFSLVELVVVIMILGVLAAVATPRFISTAGTATDNGLKQTLGIIRDAIELYAAEHGGSLPGSNLATDLDPYLRGSTFPKCPVGKKDSSVLVVSTGTALAGTGGDGSTESWKYDSTTGEFICNYHVASKVEPSVTYDNF